MTIHNSGTKTHIYSPYWIEKGLKLPRDRATINAWARSFYALDPDINRIINSHALLITNSYQIIDGDSKDINNFFKQQLEDLRFPFLIKDIIQEYFVIGEVFLNLELNEKKCKWNNVIIQNPDYILIKKQIVNNEEQIFLRPDENLRRICLSVKTEDINTCKSLPSEIVKLIKNGKNIPMDKYNFWYMSHKISPYDIRGNSFILPSFNIIKNNDLSKLSTEERQVIKQSLFDITSFKDKKIIKNLLLTKYSFIINNLEKLFNQKLIHPLLKLQNFNGEPPQIKFNQSKLEDYLNNT